MRSVMLCRYLINVLNKTPHRVQARRIVTNCTMVNNNARIFSRLQELPNIYILSSSNSFMPLTIVRKYGKETRNVNREIEDEDEDEDEESDENDDVTAIVHVVDVENVITMFASLIACGLDPDRSIIFRQSDVPYHTELSWILSNHCMVNKLQGVIHWKEKSQLHSIASVGLLTYPILQAADILLYKSTGVPVGKDQHQHIALTRDLAHSFNMRFGDFFPLPQIIVSETPSIKSLSSPDKKMSKSDPNTKCRIDLTDSPDEIKHKIQKSVTDALGKITYSHELRPGVSNLIDIHAGMTNKTSAEICEEHKDLPVGWYKQRVMEAVIEELKPIQEQYRILLSDRSYLQSLMTKGSEKVSSIAAENIKQVKTLVGIL